MWLDELRDGLRIATGYYADVGFMTLAHCESAQAVVVRYHREDGLQASYYNQRFLEVVGSAEVYTLSEVASRMNVNGVTPIIDVECICSQGQENQ